MKKDPLIAAESQNVEYFMPTNFRIGSRSDETKLTDHERNIFLIQELSFGASTWSCNFDQAFATNAREYHVRNANGNAQVCLPSLFMQSISAD